MNWELWISTGMFSLLGLIILLTSYKVFDWIAPEWEITKILVEDKNVALGLVIMGMFLGLSIIIHGAMTMAR